MWNSILHSSGIVPAVILICFLGVFGLYTAKLLIDFKLNHPDVHTMGTRSPINDFNPLMCWFLGDAGYIISGPVVRELLAFGTVAFAVFASVRCRVY